MTYCMDYLWGCDDICLYIDKRTQNIMKVYKYYITIICILETFDCICGKLIFIVNIWPETA